MMGSSSTMMMWFLAVFLVATHYRYAGAAVPPPVVPIHRACSTPQTSGYPFCNANLTLDTRIKNLISLLEDADKPKLLTARLVYEVPRIGLPEYSWGANCVHGIRAFCGTECATLFPNPVNLGAAWNPSLTYEMAQIIGIELRALWLQGIREYDFDNPHVGLDCWSPVINVNRDPRWGRNMEVAGEDPLILSDFGVQYTLGLQNGKLDSRYYQAVSTLKHYAAYSLEDYEGVTRHNFNAIVSAYDWANTYSVAFKAGVDAGAKGIMCSYNALNGVPTCANAFLNNTLRGEWKYDGYVTSDTDAVYDIAAEHHYTQTLAQASAVAIIAGTDINSGDTYQNNLLTAVQQGLVSMNAVNAALYRSLKIRFQLGLFDPIEDQPYWHVPPTVVNTQKSQDFNLFVAQQSLVLLQNPKSILPLRKGITVAVLGPIADNTVVPLGNYNGIPCKGPDQYACISSIFQSIRTANVGGKTVYQQGCAINSQDKSGFTAALNAAQQSEAVVLVLGIDGSIEAEGLDRVTIGFPGVQDEFAQAVVKLGKPTAVVLINGGAIATDYLTTTNTSAILEAFVPGFQAGPAIASAIFGDYNPGGKLPYTVFPSSYVNASNFKDMSMVNKPGRTYRYYSGAVLYPFGWGLSYTTFYLNIATMATRTNQTTGAPEAVIRVNVTNTGKRVGDEVVQVYFKPQGDPYLIKQLLGYERVTVQPGETVQLYFIITAAKLQVADATGKMRTFPSNTIEVTDGVYQKHHATLHYENTRFTFA